MAIQTDAHAVVQGIFSGTLQSTYNPAWDGAAGLNCSLPVPYITASPPVWTNRTSAIFNFTAEDGRHVRSDAAILPKETSSRYSHHDAADVYLVGMSM
jgi:hypothetical protein